MEDDVAGQATQLVAVGIEGRRAPAHGNATRIVLVSHGRQVRRRRRADTVLALGADANGCRAAGLIAHLVEGGHGVEVGLGLGQARVHVGRGGHRRHRDEGVGGLLGAEHRVLRQAGELAAVGVGLRCVPRYGHTAEVLGVGHRREIRRRRGRHLVDLRLAADEGGQLAQPSVATDGTDAVEGQGAVGQRAVDVGCASCGEGGAIPLQGLVATVGARGAQHVVPDQGLVLYGLPGEDDAADLVGGPHPLRGRQTGGRHLRRRGRTAQIAGLVESDDREGVGGQRLQVGVLVFPLAGGEGVDGHRTAGAGFGTQNDVAGQTGQVATVGILLRRSPAQHDAAEDVLVRHRGEALWRLGRDIVCKRCGADEGGELALQAAGVDRGDAVEERALRPTNGVDKARLARGDACGGVTVAGDEGESAIGGARTQHGVPGQIAVGDARPGEADYAHASLGGQLSGCGRTVLDEVGLRVERVAAVAVTADRYHPDQQGGADGTDGGLLHVGT